MATYRGADGYLALSTNQVGEIKSWECSLRQDSLDVSIMGDDFRRVRGGIKMGSGRAVAQFDYGDTYQKALADNIFTDNGTTIANARFYVDATKYITGTILITDFSPSGSYNAIFMANFAFDFSSTYSITWV